MKRILPRTDMFATSSLENLTTHHHNPVPKTSFEPVRVPRVEHSRIEYDTRVGIVELIPAEYGRSWWKNFERSGKEKN